MPLRSIPPHLKQHDWTGVMVEVMVVIVGVFIGLQVSNWNDDRKDAARGSEYLRRLDAELLQDAESLRTISGFWTQVYANGVVAVGYAENGTLQQDSAWKTLLAYYQASQVWPYRKPDTVFQEIRSTGDLQLIRNQELRARIARHYSGGAGSQVVEVLGLIPRYREDVRGMTPWKIQQYIWANCWSSPSDEQQLMKDCASPVSEADAQAVLDQYRQSAELTRELRFWLANVNNGIGLMQQISSDAEALAHDIRAELSR
jgi:hypothetical protein